MAEPPQRCPLCAADPSLGAVRPFAEIHGSLYFRCERCRLTFLSPGDRLPSAEEMARYATHENDPADPRYREFLSRLATPLVERLPEGARGLDYGSGPGPTLSVMLEEAGLEMSVYDPFFAPDEGVFDRTYDFITCTETVEHFFRPAEEFDRFDRLLGPGGQLGIMTGILLDDAAFESWWYVRDPTHVCFYRPESFEWIAARYGWHIDFPVRNVVIFRKAG